MNLAQLHTAGSAVSLHAGRELEGIARRYRVEPNFIQDLIAAIQHQLRALDCSLELLHQRHEVAPVHEDTDPRNPVCPKCASLITDITTMGASRAQYACTVCEFQGPL